MEALEQDNDFAWVLWLDADMVGSVELVAGMIGVLESAIMDLDSSLERAPLLSGLYVTRQRPSHFAAQRRPLSVPALHVAWLGQSVQLEPVNAGMGCLLQTRESFLRHVNESGTLDWGDRLLPMVCESRSKLEHVGRGTRKWFGEDWDYCHREWEHGGGVYLAPFRWGHVAYQELYPDESTQLIVDGAKENGRNNE